jgi:hypothetical protein
MSFFPMRQQQTGMYWQQFIITEIKTKHLEKVGDRHAHPNTLLPQGVSLIVTPFDIEVEQSRTKSQCS